MHLVNVNIVNERHFILIGHILQSDCSRPYGPMKLKYNDNYKNTKILKSLNAKYLSTKS